MRQHRLSRPGLARDRIQPLAKAQFRLLDQQQILDPKLAQHGVCLALRAAGPVAAALPHVLGRLRVLRYGGPPPPRHPPQER